MPSETKGFTSRAGLLFAMLGMAVGTGNIWRFPRILASNGGGTFLLPWILFLVLWSIPLILTEFALGRGMKAGPLGSFVRLLGPKFAWMGAWITFVATAIMCYYSVVAGWTLRYFYASVFGELSPDAPDKEYFSNFFNVYVDSYWPLVTHVLAIALALAVIWFGVAAIQRVTSILLPSLVFLVLVLAIRAVTLPGAGAGLAFMFTVNWDQLGDYKIWLNALAQNAWDTGAGWGLITTYALYLRKSDDNTLNAFILGIGNNTVSLLAGIAVLCTIFSVMPDAQSRIVGAGNYGLTFEWIPQLFGQIYLGRFLMVLFFAALFMAAWTSLISGLELTTRGFQDIGLTRHRALILVCGIALVAGIPSAVSIDFLGNQDWVWGVALMVCGLFFAFAVIWHGVRRFREVYVNVPANDIYIGKWWEVVIAGLVPVQGIALLVWWFWQTFPEEKVGTITDRIFLWLNPISTFNTGTALAQWAVVIGGLLLLNGWLGWRVTKQELPETEGEQD